MSGKPEEPAQWGAVATALWAIFIAGAFVIVQTMATLVVVLQGRPWPGQAEMEALLKASGDSGAAVSLAIIATTLVGVPLVAGIAKLKPGAQLPDYFALRPLPVAAL